MGRSCLLLLITLRLGLLRSALRLIRRLLTTRRRLGLLRSALLLLLALAVGVDLLDLLLEAVGLPLLPLPLLLPSALSNLTTAIRHNAIKSNEILIYGGKVRGK